MAYETMVSDLWVEDFYPSLEGETDWLLISIFEYYYEISTEEQDGYDGRLSGTKVRAVFQREIPDTVGVNWAGWLTGAAIVASIWLTAILILS